MNIHKFQLWITRGLTCFDPSHPSELRPWDPILDSAPGRPRLPASGSAWPTWSRSPRPPRTCLESYAKRRDATTRGPALRSSGSEEFYCSKIYKREMITENNFRVKAYWFIKSVIIYNYISLLICKCNFQQWVDSITYDHNQSSI